MTGNDRIEALRKREAEIRAKIALEESKRRKREEKDMNRVKLLVGSAIIADIEKNADAKAGIVAILSRATIASKDRDFLKAKGWL